MRRRRRARRFLGRTENYDAVVLDLGLPTIDGLTLLRRWREAGLPVPVLVLTARGSWHEKVQGIDGGADDYVAKPFRMEEVLARLRALIRRASGQVTPELRGGAVALDPRMARVTLDGVPVKLTSHEFRVLSYLMHQRGRVVSQGELTEHIYAQSADRDSNTVEVFVARLRRKLGGIVHRDGARPRLPHRGRAKWIRADVIAARSRLLLGAVAVDARACSHWRGTVLTISYVRYRSGRLMHPLAYIARVRRHGPRRSRAWSPGWRR